jgi:glutamate decarboxylase
LVPVSAATPYLTPETAVAHCDAGTIGVVAILGSTYDGSYEPVEEIAGALHGLQSTRGIDIPIHVDAASGGFIAPFLDPDLVWDFRLDRVVSINASGHKFGLVYPGVGWALWRDASALPEELVFKVDYLGGEMPTFTLNFSRPGAQVVGQYYNFLRLGRAGYRAVQAASRETATWLSGAVDGLGPFALLSRGGDIPAFAFRLREPGRYSVYDLSDELRMRGWIVPAYAMPPAIEETAVLRVVVRNGFSQDLATLFLADLRSAVDRLAAGGGGISDQERTGFHH